MSVYRGAILTCDAQDHVYKYLVEDNGRIAYVGDELPARYASWPMTDLGQKALIPAFGASNHSVAEGKFVTRQELDEACPASPCS